MQFISTKFIHVFLFIAVLFLIACSETQIETAKTDSILIEESSEEKQDSIIETHFVNGALQYHYYDIEWQEEIDKGLAKDSTIAYLWQQKAMPLFKQGKYELGMTYIDKAVKYDEYEYQPYRAFIKCIFANTYSDAIADFEDCKAKFGNSHVMDHTYNFYIALCKIQLNQFEEAEQLLTVEVDHQLATYGEEWVHFNALFYLGIAQYEQKKYDEAILAFDKAISLYPEFSDAIYYKGKCFAKLGDTEKSALLIEQARVYGKQGYTINEDNAFYEKYPYQIRWELWD